MRTTIDLDEELLRTAKALSAARGETLSRVIVDLAWKGLRSETVTGRNRSGFPVLSAVPGGQPVTPEHVAALLNDEDLAL